MVGWADRWVCEENLEGWREERRKRGKKEMKGSEERGSPGKREGRKEEGSSERRSKYQASKKKRESIREQIVTQMNLAAFARMAEKREVFGRSAGSLEREEKRCNDVVKVTSST